MLLLYSPGYAVNLEIVADYFEWDMNYTVRQLAMVQIQVYGLWRSWLCPIYDSKIAGYSGTSAQMIQH